MAALLLWLAGDLASWLAAAAAGARAALRRVHRGRRRALYFAALFVSGVRMHHMRNAGA